MNGVCAKNGKLEMQRMTSKRITSVAAFCSLVACGLGQAEPLPAQGTWETTLIPQDLDGDGVTDSFYDTDLKLTWLRNANLTGQMTWADATSWADGFSFGGFDDWRLPASDQCFGPWCNGSEMGHLWHVTLGNSTHGPMTNTALFENLLPDFYWTSTDLDGYPGVHLMWNQSWGSLHYQTEISFQYSMLVRGPVAAVPEPDSRLVIVGGLLLVLVGSWRHGLRSRCRRV